MSHLITPALLYLALIVGALGVAWALPRRGPNPQVLGGLAAAGAGGLVILLLTGRALAEGEGLPNLFFYIFSVVALGGALRVITHRRPVYAALYFILTILSSAGMYVILAAEFMAFALVIVYAGAILITYLFVIMLASQAPTEGQDEALAEYDSEAREPLAAAGAGFLLLAVLTTMLFAGARGLTPAGGPDVRDTLARLPGGIEGALRARGAIQAGERLTRADAVTLKDKSIIWGDIIQAAEDPIRMTVSIGAVEQTKSIPLADVAKIEENRPRIDWEIHSARIVDQDGLERSVMVPADLAPTNVEGLGFNLLADYPGSIEIAGIILLMAMLGAVVLARRKVQLEEEDKARLGPARRGRGGGSVNDLLFQGLLAQSAMPQPMGGVTLAHYLFVSAAMFAIGLIGFLTRRNLIIMFLCTELMFQGAGLALIAFSRFHLNYDGQTFVIFVLTVAAAEAAMALALVVLLFRRKETLDAEEWQEMKG